MLLTSCKSHEKQRNNAISITVRLRSRLCKKKKEKSDTTLIHAVYQVAEDSALPQNNLKMTSNRLPIIKGHPASLPLGLQKSNTSNCALHLLQSINFPLHILRASAREATHASHKFFRSRVLLLTWPFHVSWKHHSPALTARKALPTF